MRKHLALITTLGWALTAPAIAQDGALSPHVGGKVTTAFSNHFGPDAESTLTFLSVQPDSTVIGYESSRGLSVQRTILGRDQASARKYVLGYAAKMPAVITNTTSLGISGAVLDQLRSSGRASLALVYDADLSEIDGTITLAQKGAKISLLIENQLVEAPAITAIGSFGTGSKTGTGEFYFLDNKNNPMMLQSVIRFSWEDKPREEKIVRIAAGTSMRSAMEQSLATLRKYDLYGLHFDFDKASLRRDAASLIDEIAQTLKNNPTWTLQINGHTDSLGEPAYNRDLSAKRAAAVAAALISRGIESGRLKSDGFGEAQPKDTNDTLQGRAVNRRVELLRTDK